MATHATAVSSFVLLLIASSSAAAQAQSLPATNAAAAGAPSSNRTFVGLQEALATANTTRANLTILVAALNSSGILSLLTANASGAGPATMLAPTNAAFERRLRKDLNMTPADLLMPANNATLLKVLQYHFIPGAALLSSQLVNQNLTTALPGAQPLRVLLRGGRKKARFVGATNAAAVVARDICVRELPTAAPAGGGGGGCVLVIHVVNDVLLPEGVGKGKGKHNRRQGRGSSSRSSRR